MQSNKSRFVYSEYFRVDVRQNVGILLYPDSRPHNLEIADLQKGLILVVDGVELVGEGAGFGVPVVKYVGNTYFSQTAQSSFDDNPDCPTMEKSFVINTVSKKRIGNRVFLNDKLYGLFHKYFEKLYLGWKNSRYFLDKLMELRKTLKINTQFVKGEEKGRVTVKYRIFPKFIEVDVNFRELNRKGIKEILILNEQSSTFFRNYSDADGNYLLGKHIGAWEKVNAKEATFSDAKKGISFTLKNIKGTKLYRGREQVKNRFEWAGFTYSLEPNIDRFNYLISLKKN